MENNKCHICGGEGYKTDTSGVWCKKCLGIESERVPIVKNKKIERNTACPCGSGKKFKKCCMLRLKR